MKTAGNANRRQRGSAFFVAMMVLAVLSIIGLSLALVTDTEMLLGANERVVGEAFYAAEAGVTTMVSKLLVTNSAEYVELVVPSFYGENNDNFQLGYDVQTSGLMPVSIEEMPYTKANEGRADKFYSAYLFGMVRAQRTSWRSSKAVPDCDDLERVLAERQLVVGFYHAPMGKLQAGEMINFERAGLDVQAAQDMCEVKRSGTSTFAGESSFVGRESILRQSSGQNNLF